MYFCDFRSILNQDMDQIGVSLTDQSGMRSSFSIQRTSYPGLSLIIFNVHN